MSIIQINSTPLFANFKHHEAFLLVVQFVIFKLLLYINLSGVLPESGGGPHKGLKLPKRFTNLPSDSSACPGEKGRSCIKRKKITWDPIKILYFLHVLPFSPWDSQCKPTSEKTGHSIVISLHSVLLEQI